MKPTVRWSKADETAVRNAFHMISTIPAAAAVALFAAAAGSSQSLAVRTNPAPPAESAADFAAGQTRAPLTLTPNRVVDFPLQDSEQTSWQLSKPYITADGFATWGTVQARGDFSWDSPTVVGLFDDAGKPVTSLDVGSSNIPDDLIALPDGELIAVHHLEAEEQGNLQLTRLRTSAGRLEIVDVTEMPAKYAYVSPMTPDARILLRPIMDPPSVVITDFSAGTTRTALLDEANEADQFGQWNLLAPADDGMQYLLARRRVGSGRLSVTEFRRYTLTEAGLVDPKPIMVYPLAHVAGVDVVKNHAFVLSYDPKLDENPHEMGTLAPTLRLNKIDTLDLANAKMLSSNPLEVPINSDWSGIGTAPDSAAFANRLAITTLDNRVAVIDSAGFVHSLSEPLANVIDSFNATPDGSRLLAQSRTVYAEDGSTPLVPARVHVFVDNDQLQTTALLEPTTRLVGPVNYSANGTWNLHGVLALDGTFVANAAPSDNPNAVGRVVSFAFDGSLNGWPIAGAVDPRVTVYLAPVGPTSFAAFFDYVVSGATAEKPAEIRPAFAVLQRGEKNEGGGYSWRWAATAFLDRKFVHPGPVNRPGHLGLWIDVPGENGEPPMFELYDFSPALAEVDAEMKFVREFTYPDDIRSIHGAHISEDGTVHWVGSRPSPDNSLAKQYVAFSAALKDNAAAVQRVLVESPFPHSVVFDHANNQLVILTHEYDGEESVFVNRANRKYPKLNRLTRIDVATGAAGAPVALTPLLFIISVKTGLFGDKLVVHSDSALHILDATTGRIIAQTIRFERGLSSFSISADGRTMVVLLTPDFDRNGTITANEELLIFELPE